MHGAIDAADYCLDSVRVFVMFFRKYIRCVRVSSGGC